MDIKLEEEKINRMRHEAMMHSNANGLTRTLVNMRKQIAEAVAAVSAAKAKLKTTEKASWKKSYAPETEPKEIQKTHNSGKIYHEEVEQVDEVKATEDNESHTHAAHFENDKGEWTGMQLFSAKDDDDAIQKAHELAKEHGKLSSVVKHVQIKENEILDEAPLTKAEREAKRAARNARMAGSVKNAVQKLSTVGKKKAGLAKPEPKKPEETPLQKLKKANQSKQDAYYAKGGREGFGSGGGTRNSSPLEKALTAVKEKPAKGAGASPAEIEAEKERKKKEAMAGYEKVKPLKGKIIGEDLKVGDKDDDGKMEVEKKTGGKIKQSQSLVDKAKRKYLGTKKGKTMTGSKAHMIDTEPKISTPEDKKLGK